MASVQLLSQGAAITWITLQTLTGTPASPMNDLHVWRITSSMKYYYTNAQNQPTGPVSLEELRSLLSVGAIAPTAYVIQEGSQQWVPLSSVLSSTPTPTSTPAPQPTPTAQQPAPTPQATPAVTATPIVNKPVATSIPVTKPVVETPRPAAAPATGPSRDFSTFLVDAVSSLLNHARRLLTVSLVERVLSFCTHGGQWLILSAAILAMVASLIFAIKTNTMWILLIGPAGVIIIAVLQYIATRFLQGCGRLVKNTPSTLSSAAVPDCIALFALLGASGALIGGFIYAVETSDPSIFVGAVLISAMLILLGAIALNPKVTQTAVGQASAGEEGIGLISFFMKLPVVLLPVGYFILNLAGALFLLSSLFGNGSTRYGRSNFEMPGERLLSSSLPMVEFPPGLLSGLSMIICALSLPFICYILFLIFHLLVDVIRSIVCLPGKIDATRQK